MLVFPSAFLRILLGVNYWDLIYYINLHTGNSTQSFGCRSLFWFVKQCSMRSILWRLERRKIDRCLLLHILLLRVDFRLSFDVHSGRPPVRYCAPHSSQHYSDTEKGVQSTRFSLDTSHRGHTSSLFFQQDG